MISKINNYFRQKLLIDFIGTEELLYLVFSKDSSRPSGVGEVEPNATVSTLSGGNVTPIYAVKIDKQSNIYYLSTNTAGAASEDLIVVNGATYLKTQEPEDLTKLWKSLFFSVMVSKSSGEINYNTVSVVSGLTGTSGAATISDFNGVGFNSAVILIQSLPDSTDLPSTEEVFQGIISF
jgi:hypothetical protein